MPQSHLFSLKIGAALTESKRLGVWRNSGWKRDVVAAITVGVVLAALLFTRELAQMTTGSEITHHRNHIAEPLPEGWVAHKVTGALFYPAADRVFDSLAMLTQDHRGVLLYMDGVPTLDSGGVNALERFRRHLLTRETKLVVADWQAQPRRTLKKAVWIDIPDRTFTATTLADALTTIPTFGAQND